MGEEGRIGSVVATCYVSSCEEVIDRLSDRCRRRDLASRRRRSRLRGHSERSAGGRGRLAGDATDVGDVGDVGDIADIADVVGCKIG